MMSSRGGRANRSDRPWAFALASALAACAPHVEHSSSDDAPPTLNHRPASPVPSRTNPAEDGGLGEDACASLGCGAPGAQRFVIIGDYGLSGPEEAKVAELTAELAPDFVVTTGDNNYPYGGADTIDENIGRYFHQFIAPYRGSFGSGALENRFFPCLGNHDWYTPGAGPYLDYFALPNNERYYDVIRGSVQLFALDSDPSEPDGVAPDSAQARWFQDRIRSSSTPWRIVYFHHPPYSSGPHGSTLAMRWPFKEWGASLIFTGHDHTYERLRVNGLTYIVNGVGGNDLYPLGEPLPESRVRHADVHGLVFVTATPTELVSRFLDARGQELDVIRLSKP